MQRLMLIGLVLIVISLILTLAGSQQLQSTQSNTTLHSLFIYPHNAVAIPTTVGNSTVFGGFYYSNNSNVTYYFMNSRAFSAILPYLNSSMLLNDSIKQEGNGIYQIIYDNPSGIFPDQHPSLVPPSYRSNGSDLYGSGTYYTVFQNTGSVPVIVYYSILQKLQIALGNAIVSNALTSLFSSLMFVVGIGLVIYSFIFVKGKQENDESPKVHMRDVKDDDIDRLYEQYATKGRTSGHASRPRKKRGKTRI